ncbi:hypothetical protein LZ198_01495 [Myxococcus sp. K15C18031901]|uniref:hypothetical protein n=1 Tax=Myxococcus dinghuensis TaxID=2906761 RepID=UPI0020A7BC0F|nr:hypothetical protein [Myxococcus dinghuensis]MCP3097543.1 hypothetical protein [Myxococcus dinghuensis]
MARNASVTALLPVEAEFQKEKAQGLRRTGEKLEQALAALASAEAALGPVGAAGRATRFRRYTELRQEAETQRWYLMVQREACGVRNHTEMDLLFPMPPRIRE